MKDEGDSSREVQGEASPATAGTQTLGGGGGGTSTSGGGKVQRRGLPRTTRDVSFSAGPGTDLAGAGAPPPGGGGGGGAGGGGDPSSIHAAAAQGVATPGGELPHRGQLEGAFGLDLSSIVAHTGPEAQGTADAMGANAYASGNHVVLPSNAGVGLVAHEVTHVFQQAGGVHLSGGVDGGASDPLERQADAVGAAVERGESVAHHFSSPAGGSAAAGASVQRDSKSDKPAAPAKTTVDEEEALRRLRIDRATSGLTLVTQRWKDALPKFFATVTEVPNDIAIPRFRQTAYNLIIQDRVDVPPVRSVLDAPGREEFAKALHEAAQIASVDQTSFDAVRKDITDLIAGGQLQRIRTNMIANHAMLSKWGKRALAEVLPIGVGPLVAYVNGDAKAHGELEDKHLGTSVMSPDSASYGRGSSHRPIACSQLVAMITTGAPKLEEKDPVPAVTPEGAPAEKPVDPEVAKKRDELIAKLTKAVEDAEARAKVSLTRVMPSAELSAILLAIENAGEEARKLVWADSALMGRLAIALDPTQSRSLLDKLDLVERLYQECCTKRDAIESDQEKQLSLIVRLQFGSKSKGEKMRESFRFKPGSSVFVLLKDWLVARPGTAGAPMRNRLLEHTKLKDDIIDRLPPNDGRVIYRLIKRGTDTPTPEDKVHEGAEKNDGVMVVEGLRELASVEPWRVRELMHDRVFQAAIQKMSAPVRLKDGQTVRPYHLCLVMWGFEPGEASDPGTIKLSEVDPTGANKVPLTIQQRVDLEQKLFEPALKEIFDEITGVNMAKVLGDNETRYSDQGYKYQNLARIGKKADPQRVMDILVKYDRLAAQPDMVKLLRQDGLVFGKELDKKFTEKFNLDLRTWVYENSGPHNRSGSNRVLGTEQGSSVGMFNGKFLFAGEAAVQGKMTLHQALREHVYPKGPSGKPIYEWASVESREVARGIHASNKDRVLEHWTLFQAAVVGAQGEMESATGIVPIRAIDLMRNAHLEHSGHMQTNLKTRFGSKPADFAAINTAMGLDENVDKVPGAPLPTVAEHAERIYAEPAKKLWEAMDLLYPTSPDPNFGSAAVLYRGIPLLPPVPEPAGAKPAAPVDPAAPRPAGHSVEERPPRSFAGYYRLHYGTSPLDHVVAVIRSLGKDSYVSRERAASLFGIDVGLVTGPLAIPQEDGSIGEHNRHLVRASFKESTAKTKAQQIWALIVADGKFQEVMKILGEHNDEEQRLIRVAFRRISGGLDIAFYVRSAMDERKREFARRMDKKTGLLETGLTIVSPGASVAKDYDLYNNSWKYGSRVGAEGTAEAQGIKTESGKDIKNDGKWESRSTDSELLALMSVATSGSLDMRTRIRAAIKRDAHDETLRVIDELTVAERKVVLQDGELLSSLHSFLRQYEYERAFKVLTGQGDLADRLYSRSHGGSWSERKLFGGTDEEGMRSDIRIYIRQIRMKHNDAVRGEVTRMLAVSSMNRAPGQQSIDKEVDRRVGEDCAKVANDKSVLAIMNSELESDEKAEMQAIIDGKGTARDWAVAGGGGKAEIMADIQAMTLERRKERLDDPNYMRLLGQRLTDEKDYRDAINALSEGTNRGNGLSVLDEKSRSGSEASGAESKDDETLAALASLTREEFEQLKGNPKLQLQVMAACKDDKQRDMVRAFLAGGPGKLVHEAPAPAVDPGVTPAAPTVGPDGQPVPAAPVDPVKAAEEKKKKDEELAKQKKEENIQYLVHQSIYKIRFPTRTEHSWSAVLEGAVGVFKADLPGLEVDDKGKPNPKTPRQLVWNDVEADVIAFGAKHDAERLMGGATTLTTQDITGAKMQEIVKAGVLMVADPSTHLIQARIQTIAERNEDSRRKGEKNPLDSSKPKTHLDDLYKEEVITKTLNDASDAHVVQHWTTYMAGPPGGKAGPTMKQKYDAYRVAFDKALPRISEREEKAKAKNKPEPPPPTPQPVSPTDVAGGGDAAIDKAADKAKAPEWTKENHALGDKDKDIADAELRRREFLEFQIDISWVFEEMLRPYMGDGRGLTPDGTYNPDRAVISATTNKRYNTLIEVLKARFPHLNPDVIAAKLGMVEHDKWLLKTTAREEIAHMALAKQKNNRWGGYQNNRTTASEEKETLDVTSFLYYKTFANAMTDGDVNKGEKEELGYRRSENDRARDSYKTALETSAMWASLITSVLVTIAATILTGGLAIGPLSMMAIGGVTALLSATAQAAVNKEILGHEFDSKDKRELITKEVITGLVTMGTTYYAQKFISVAGKVGGKLFQQAGAYRQVLGKPPTLWGAFLREGSEEATSELMSTVVDAQLEATNPEHWIEGTKQGAKQAQAASSKIMAQAGDKAWTAALTSIVTAGVSKTFRKGRAGNEPEFEAPTTGKKREVNIRQNIKRVFGDPEEKFTGALVEWAMTQEGPIDWANAPANLLKGLLQEYKEVGTETHVNTAHAGDRARKVERHMKIWGHTLNATEKADYEKVVKSADDTEPFVTIHDYARIRTEVAVTGMQTWEKQNKRPLTTNQRDAFVEWVREAETPDELYRRAKSDPMAEGRVRNADLGSEGTAIGKPLDSDATARQVMRDLADGRADSLRRLGIEPPPDFDPTKNEWGLGRRTDPVTREVSYILVRGTAGEVNWSRLPNVEAIGHSHPNLASNQLKNLDPNGSIAVADLIATPGPDRVHFLPSGGDLVFVEANRVSEHTVFTPFQSRGNGRVANAVPGSGNPGVNIIIRNPQRVGDLFGNPDMPVVRAEIEIRAGNEILWTGPIWGAHHPSAGSVIYDHEPTDHMDLRRPRAGGRDLTGTTAHERQVPPHERPTGQMPAVNVDESNAPPPHERPTGQMPAVNVDESNAPPAAPDVRVNPPQVVKVKRDAAAVGTDFPQLAHTAALPAGAMFGAHHRSRAELALQKMSDEDYLAVQGLIRGQATPLAQGFLFKALAAGNTVADVKWMAGQIQGQPDDWLLDNLTLGDPRQVGVGTVQQWSMSCNASMTLTLRGNYDPVFALNFRLRNTDVADVNYDDPTQHNAYQADLEKQMLERAYPGGGWGQDARHGGQARPRADQNAALGRGADDLLNDIDTLGMKFDTQFVANPGAAIPALDRALMQGLQVPVVIGDERINTAHYILAMARRENAGVVEYQFHDTANGRTVWVSQADILRGTMPFAFGRIYGLEVPQSAPTQAVVEGGDAADRRPAGPRPDAAPGMARGDQGSLRVTALKNALRTVRANPDNDEARRALDDAILAAGLTGPEGPGRLQLLRSKLTESEMSRLLVHLTKQQLPPNLGSMTVDDDDWKKSSEQQEALAAAKAGTLNKDQRDRLISEINRQVPDVALTREVQQKEAKSVATVVAGGGKKMNDELIGYQFADSDIIPQRQQLMQEVFTRRGLVVVEQTYKVAVVTSTKDAAGLKAELVDAMMEIDQRMKPIVQRALMIGLEYWQKKATSGSKDDRKQAKTRVANIQQQLIELLGSQYTFDANIGVAAVQGTSYEAITAAKMNATKAAYLTRLKDGPAARAGGDKRVLVFDQTQYTGIAIEAQELRGRLKNRKIRYHGRALDVIGGDGKVNDELLTAVRKGKIDPEEDLKEKSERDAYADLKRYYDLVNSMDFMTYAKGAELATEVEPNIRSAQTHIDALAGGRDVDADAIAALLRGREGPDGRTTSQKGTASEAQFFNQTVALGDRVLLAADMRGLGNDVFEANAAALAQLENPNADMAGISARTSDTIIDKKRARIERFRNQYRDVLLPAARAAANGDQDLLAILNRETEPPLLLGGDEITVSLHPVFQDHPALKRLNFIPMAVGFLTDPAVNARVAVARTGIDGNGSSLEGHKSALKAADPAQGILKDYEELARDLFENLRWLRGQDLEDAQKLIEDMGGYYVTVKPGGGAQLTNAQGTKVNVKKVTDRATELKAAADRARNNG